MKSVIGLGLTTSVRFRVAGRCPNGYRARHAGMPGVEFTGTVPEMRTEIARATVCAAPLRIGSGTRFKILEAAAMARPIVSTTLGAEGLELVDGEEILLEDEPRRFAATVAALLADPAHRRALGDAARQRIVKQYSQPVLQSSLRTALAQALA